MRLLTEKRGQLTIFIIIALVIVGGVIAYFVVRNNLFISSIPAEFQPVYSYYDECIKQEALAAVDLAESQGGHIYVDDYIPGSEYAPFSSQLNFLGFPVPYWYYVSGNGLIKEQVPTKGEMEEEIARYVAERVNECNFDNFYAQGFSIEFGEASADVRIEDTKVSVDVNSNVAVSKGESSARKTAHVVEVQTKLGKFYDLARQIYGKQKEEAYLENYAVDVLRLYAPVDGVELSCAPKIWKTQDVVDEVKTGLEGNIQSIKFRGSYYSLSSKEKEYFVINQDVDESVSLIYSKNWPTKIEITGASDELMIAEPVGNEEGLGIIGFCYAPYHFVYDLSFPVLIQIYDGIELFQFPVVVVVDKNLPRQGIYSEIQEDNTQIDACDYKMNDIQVNLYDTNLNPVDANVSYRCFNELCNLGESEDGLFVGKAPACLNGYVEVRKEGYSPVKQLFSTNSESFADVIMDREHEVELRLEVGGKPLSGTAIVVFEGKRTVSTSLPEQNKVQLSEGNYNVSVYVYGNSSITIPASKKTQCQDVPQSGVLGLFGSTKEQCFDITIPETKIDYALLGGGKSELYILESQLEEGRIKVIVDSLPAPNSLEQLQYNYASFESLGVNLDTE